MTIDEASLRAFFSSPQGAIAVDLARRAIRVETAAKLNATGQPVAGANNPEGRGPRVRTGRLRSSITWVLREDALSLYADIGTNVFYGRHLELGELPSGRSYPFLLPALTAAR